MEEWVDGWVGESCMVAWAAAVRVDGQVNGWIDERVMVDGWIGGLMDGLWNAQWMDGWLDCDLMDGHVD